MTKHKVSELDGALLDAAVGKLESRPPRHAVHVHLPTPGQVDPPKLTLWNYDEETCVLWSPSTDWSQGGPIIERERISLDGRSRNGDPIGEWCARIHPVRLHFGSTPLIAAMRAYVASKFGDTVDLPE